MLGQSLAVLFDIVPKARYASIREKYTELETPFGYRINDFMPDPKTPEEERAVQLVVQKTNQYGTIWPFVHGFAILALEKMGEHALAVEQFRRWDKLEGFYEWYDASTGQPFGSNQQLWSAALYLAAARTLGIDDESCRRI